MVTTVGVLALQGGVREHVRMLESLGARVSRVRRPEDLERIDGILLPGGESTVIDRLARSFGLRDPLVARLRAGLPAFGTCAGMILLADRLADGAAGQRTFGGLDVTVRRNAFGGQAASFDALLDAPAIGPGPVAATFIRAPIVADPGSADVLASLPDGRVVAVEQGPILAAAFHPELTGEDRLHRRFLARARAA
ncbi:pyridoxal 5'-phosphate synthase glutaminase subunit PdxT [Microbacterium indicum]|uniref:pyridoxal 5'-phosphate synthase glutaminase subunit PdxT n=1 Tax=Microbacterium indicum TaxID=358100 RepID=UPI00040EE964|nr:pyridoxal 5'-phosphate synthase glutaminase subunit PdxT [Microbacterium indicum]